MTVVNGKLVSVEAVNFVGQAGLQGNTVAFIPTNPARNLGPGDSLKVDGQDRKVQFVAKSSYVKGMLLVTLI